MSSFDLRQIAIKSQAGKPDWLFQSAVSAFCSLTRPTSEAVLQLDELTRPLYDQVSAETLRYASAALSECKRAPVALLRRLAGEQIHIAAPILMRSRVLTDAELIDIIGRNGITHARAIRLRPKLSQAIQELIQSEEAGEVSHRDAASLPSADSPIYSGPPLPEGHHRPGSAAEAARERLRAVMAANAAGPSANRVPSAADDIDYERLRDAALKGPTFRAALADLLDVGFAQTSELVRTGRHENLARALKGVGFPAQNAFLILAIVFPGAFSGPDQIRKFLMTYAATTVEDGREEIRALRAESISAVLAQSRNGLQPASGPQLRVVKAS
ncbi:MAG: DUF2336 domain-containing protein [Mesorhizobium sp.]